MHGTVPAYVLGMSTRKIHLQHTVHRGPTCQTGRTGGALRGEHLTVVFTEFAQSPDRCTRCQASKLFAFLERRAHTP